MFRATSGRANIFIYRELLQNTALFAHRSRLILAMPKVA